MTVDRASRACSLVEAKSAEGGLRDYINEAQLVLSSMIPLPGGEHKCSCDCHRDGFREGTVRCSEGLCWGQLRVGV